MDSKGKEADLLPKPVSKEKPPKVTITEPKSEDEEDYHSQGEDEDRGEDDQLTKLEYSFTFWFSYFKENKLKQVDDYENFIKKIGEFGTAEEFWGFYQHIRRPDSLPKSCEFYLFKSGIRPLWEDPANKGGGRFVLHVKKIFANKTWEDMLIALVISTKSEGDVNGVVINVRSWEVLLSVWMAKLPDEESVERYRTWIRKSLGITENIKIEYKEHPNPEEVKTKGQQGDDAGKEDAGHIPEEEDEEKDSSAAKSKEASSKQGKQEETKKEITHGKSDNSGFRQVGGGGGHHHHNKRGGRGGKHHK